MCVDQWSGLMAAVGVQAYGSSGSSQASSRAGHSSVTSSISGSLPKTPNQALTHRRSSTSSKHTPRSETWAAKDQQRRQSREFNKHPSTSSEKVEKQPAEKAEKMIFAKHVSQIYAIAEATLQYAVPDAALESGSNVGAGAVRAMSPLDGLSRTGSHHRVSFLEEPSPTPKGAATITPAAAVVHQQRELPAESTAAVVRILETLSVMPEGNYWHHVPPPQSLITRLLDLLVWWPTADPTSQSVSFLLLQLPPTTFFADAVARKAPSLGSLLASSFMPATAAVTLLRSVSAIVSSEAPAVQHFGRELSAPQAPLRSRVCQALQVYRSVNDVLVQSATTLGQMIRTTDSVVPGEPAALARTARDATTVDVVAAAVHGLVTAASSIAYGGWNAVSMDCSSEKVPLVPAFARAMLAAEQDRETLDKVLAAMTAASEASAPADVMGDATMVVQLITMAADAQGKPSVQEQLLRCAASAASQSPSDFAPRLDSLKVLATVIANVSGANCGAVIAAAARLARHSASRAVLAAGLLNGFIAALSTCAVSDLPSVLELIASSASDPAWLRVLQSENVGNRLLLLAATATVPLPSMCRIAYLVSVCTPDAAAADLLRTNPVALHVFDTEEQSSASINPLTNTERATVQNVRDLMSAAAAELEREKRDFRNQIDALTKERNDARDHSAALGREVSVGKETVAREALKREEAEGFLAFTRTQGPQRSNPTVTATGDAVLAAPRPPSDVTPLTTEHGLLALMDDESAQRLELFASWATISLRLREALVRAVSHTTVSATAQKLDGAAQHRLRLLDVEVTEGSARKEIDDDASAAFASAHASLRAATGQQGGTQNTSSVCEVLARNWATAKSSDTVLATTSWVNAVLHGCVDAHLQQATVLYWLSRQAVIAQSTAQSTQSNELLTRLLVEEGGARTIVEAGADRVSALLKDQERLERLEGTESHHLQTVEQRCRDVLQLRHTLDVNRVNQSAQRQRAELAALEHTEATARHEHFEVFMNDVWTASAGGMHHRLVAAFDAQSTLKTRELHALQATHAKEVTRLVEESRASEEQLRQRGEEKERARETAATATDVMGREVQFLREQVQALTEQHALAQRRLDAALENVRAGQQRITALERENVTALGAAEKVKTETATKMQTLTSTNKFLERQVEQAKADLTATRERFEADKEEMRTQLKQAWNDAALLRTDLNAERHRSTEAMDASRSQHDSAAKLTRERDTALAAQATLTDEIARLKETLAAAGRQQAATEEELTAAKTHNNRYIAEANVAKDDLRRQLIMNTMAVKDVQHLVAECHNLRVELAYLQQHNLIEPTVESPADAKNNGAQQASTAQPQPQPQHGDISIPLSLAELDDVLVRHRLPPRADIVKLVDVAADLTGSTSTAAELRIDPAMHPKDCFIAKLISSLRATSRALQETYVAADKIVRKVKTGRSPSRRAVLEHDRTAIAAAEISGAKSGAGGSNGNLSLLRRRLSSAQRVDNSAIGTPASAIPVETSTLCGTAPLLRGDGRSHTPSPVPLDFGINSADYHHETNMFLAAKHATRTAARLAEAVAAQEALQAHNSLVDESKLRDARGRPRSADAKLRRLHSDPVDDNPAERKPNFELRTGMATELTPYDRASDPHLRQFLARRHPAPSSSPAARAAKASGNKLAAATRGAPLRLVPTSRQPRIAFAEDAVSGDGGGTAASPVEHADLEI
jgi:fluoride ion exporter CrcB/FEX